MIKSKEKNLISLKFEIGNFIRHSRIKNGLTGARLGELLGVSQQQISRYENGETELSLKKFIFILIELDVPFSDFISYTSLSFWKNKMI
nr:helix-turn-helix transcriptional regulator [Providencia rettgeri]